MIRVKDQNGTEALVTQAAFDLVHSKKGFVLVEEEESDPKPEPKKSKKATK